MTVDRSIKNSMKNLIVLYEHGGQGLLHRYPSDSVIRLNFPPGFVSIEDKDGRMLATYNNNAVTALRGEE